MRWRLGHRPGLDGLRGVAIALVLLDHGRVPWSGTAGRVGVTVFFVLSGFLITTLLVEERDRTGRISVRDFYARRLRRLAPAFLVSTGVICLLGLVVRNPGFLTTKDAVLAVSYVGNWYPALMSHPRPGALGVLTGTWSLAVEEQFYLLWPVLVIVALSRGRRFLAAASVIGAVLSLATHVALTAHGASELRVYSGTDVNAFALLVGAVIAVALTTTRWRPDAPFPVVPAVAGTACLVLAVPMVNWLAQQVVTVAATGVLVWVVARAETGVPVLSAPWLRWLGRRSYGIYLWNCPIAVTVYFTSMAWPLALVVVTVPALVLAALSWRYVEEPFLRRSERDTDDVGVGDPVGAAQTPRPLPAG